MSLDGFIAGPNDDVQRVFAWMFSGDTDLKVSIGEQEMDLKLSAKDAEQYEDMTGAVGAIVSGRRMFDVAGAWSGKHPMNVPVVVLTHRIPQEWVKHDSCTRVVGERASEFHRARGEQAQLVQSDPPICPGAADGFSHSFGLYAVGVTSSADPARAVHVNRARTYVRAGRRVQDDIRAVDRLRHALPGHKISLSPFDAGRRAE
jgi:dihydrofolate reductase